jgi:UDP-N-acetylmuramyl pentapeptide phosphotransferase/UDP-N-acetylglucosamine-1-phosphate transferase
MKNNSLLFYGLVTLALFLMELAYFRLARRLNILDKPNFRSSHHVPVVRGGGVIFILSTWICFLVNGFSYAAFVAGITLAGMISFMDDIRSQSRRVRLIIHVLAMLLLFYDAGVYGWPIWMITVAAIVCLGTMNAFNFMDGINGITGVYSFVCLATFFCIQIFSQPFTLPDLITITGIAVGVFLIFNFRKRAACFAGDVGSVTIAFLLIFLLLQLIIKANSFFWVMLFLVYGIDSVCTILYRIWRHENIFEAHRQHLYQYLSNEFRWPHRAVALLYGGVQLIVNYIVYFAIKRDDEFAIYVTGIATLVIYLGIREYVRRKIMFNGKILNK